MDKKDILESIFIIFCNIYNNIYDSEKKLRILHYYLFIVGAKRAYASFAPFLFTKGKNSGIIKEEQIL